MRRWMGMPIAAALVLTACVTINVYFPAAEAREAAKEFVEKVIDDADKVNVIEQPPAAPADEGGGDGDGGMAALDGARMPAIEPESEPESEHASAHPLARLAIGFDPLMLLGISPAHAQGKPDISIKTPAIQAIQARMEQRFNRTLRRGFDAGALGFTSDGLVTVRDASRLELKDRVAMNAAVAEDNRDRKAVYREVAVANGHPEWEGRIREVFAKQWIESARKGWWYQQGGSWKQK